MKRALLAMLAAAWLAAVPHAAPAGQACETRPLSTREIERGMALAQATAQRLDASGAQVVVLARAGQDLSRWGLAWSHLGLAYRETTPQGQAVWRVAHKLNACGSDRAQLYRQGLGDFFLDRPHRHEAAIAVLSRDAQARLLPLLRSNALLGQWHEPRYSMVAYPWAQRYQQSNQWALETLAGALDPQARDRSTAQAWLKLRGYQPTVLRIGALTRLGARATQAHIAFDDHPNHLRFADHIETVTVESVFSFLQRARLAGPMETVRASPTIGAPAPEPLPGERT
ncbi:hypothetical protein BurJ1DRAFT_0117 [Burkholderiales bacterium JOSHI_001]|nr:hypothetical protein BurJ1DRAFT_0117 [Burkholderiales bacterium JOSHI_001]